MLVVGAYMDGLYKTLLAAHILCAIIGFGAVFLNAIYGNEVKKHRGAEGIAIFDANEKVSKIGEYFIYAVPVFGIAMIFSSDKLWKFSQTWVWLAAGGVRGGARRVAHECCCRRSSGCAC